MMDRKTIPLGVRHIVRMAAACAGGICLTLALPASLLANTPPIPPPSPEALAAAEKLVAALPLDEALQCPSANEPASHLLDYIRSWYDRSAGDRHDDALWRAFSAKVDIELRDDRPGAIAQSKPLIADIYARRLSAAESQMLADFATTSAGRKWNAVQIQQNMEIRDMLDRQIWARLLPRLPIILAGARESRRLLEAVNRKPTAPR